MTAYEPAVSVADDVFERRLLELRCDGLYEDGAPSEWQDTGLAPRVQRLVLIEGWEIGTVGSIWCELRRRIDPSAVPRLS